MGTVSTDTATERKSLGSAAIPGLCICVMPIASRGDGPRQYAVILSHPC